MPFVNSWLKEKASQQYCLLEVSSQGLKHPWATGSVQQDSVQMLPWKWPFLANSLRTGRWLWTVHFSSVCSCISQRTILSNTTSLSIASSLNIALLADLVSPSVGGGVILRYIHKFFDTAPFIRWGETPVPLSVAGLSGLLLRKGIGRCDDLLSKTDIKGTADSSLLSGIVCSGKANCHAVRTLVLPQTDPHREKLRHLAHKESPEVDSQGPSDWRPC